MRDGLIEDLRMAVDRMIFSGLEHNDITWLMIEAADALEEFQKKNNTPSNTIFFSGNDVLDQIAKQNKEREAKGLPPL